MFGPFHAPYLGCSPACAHKSTQRMIRSKDSVIRSTDSVSRGTGLWKLVYKQVLQISQPLQISSVIKNWCYELYSFTIKRPCKTCRPVTYITFYHFGRVLEPAGSHPLTPRRICTGQHLSASGLAVSWPVQIYSVFQNWYEFKTPLTLAKSDWCVKWTQVN